MKVTLSNERRYIITRFSDETIEEFHTRVANEIRTMNCSIINAKFEEDQAIIVYKDFFTRRRTR